MNLKVNGKAPEQDEKNPLYRKSPMLLIHEIARLMAEKISLNTEDNPVSQKSGKTLLVELAKRDGRTQLELVNATHLKAPTISVALQKLEKDGYVFRRPDEYDLRATRVFLTEKGREVNAKIRRLMYEEETSALSVLTQSEIDSLYRLLLKVQENMARKKPEAGDLF